MIITVGTGPQVVFRDTFETALGWTVNPLGTDTATTGRWERADPATTSSGTKQLGTTVRGTFDLVTGPLAGLGAGDHDIDGGVTTIQSPAISIPAGGTVSKGHPRVAARIAGTIGSARAGAATPATT